jgi:hypothetical protein
MAELTSAILNCFKKFYIFYRVLASTRLKEKMGVGLGVVLKASQPTNSGEKAGGPVGSAWA